MHDNEGVRIVITRILDRQVLFIIENIKRNEALSDKMCTLTLQPISTPIGFCPSVLNCNNAGSTKVQKNANGQGYQVIEFPF